MYPDIMLNLVLSQVLNLVSDCRTVYLLGKELAHHARAAKARGISLIFEKKFMHRARARRARTGLTVYLPKSSKNGRRQLLLYYRYAVSTRSFSRNRGGP